MEPDPGLYSDVAVADFKSMYPSITRHSKISPECLSILDSNVLTQDAVSWDNDAVLTKVDERECIFVGSEGIGKTGEAGYVRGNVIYEMLTKLIT
ncbi:g2230 [Coccomyxa elongata]